MTNVLRRWSQPIMLVITVLVIVSFTYFGQNFYGRGAGSQIAVTLYDKDITIEAFQRQARRVGVFAALGGEYVQALGLAVAFGQQPDSSTVAKSFVLEHEADQLGLAATEEEKIEALQRIPAFHGPNRTFDPDLFVRFKERVLNPQGFSDGDFDQVFLTGEVRAFKLQQIVGSTVAASTAEVREQIIRRNQKTEASFIAFRRDSFRGEAKVTEEEIKQRYEEQKELYKTQEQRKVRYAAFTLPEPADGKPIENRERTAKLQELANAAYNFSQELQAAPQQFVELAKKHGANVGETKEFFTAQNPPAELEGAPEITEKAFALTKEAPHSPHISLQKGTYVLELMEIKPPEPRTYEDVKPEIEQQLILTKAEEIARTKANEARPKLDELMKSGKSFADAAKELGLTVEMNPTIGGGQRTPPGQFAEVIGPSVGKLAPGEISEVLTSKENDAALIVHVDHRSEVPEAEIEAARASETQRIEDGFPPFAPGMRYIVFQNWLAERARLAGLEKFFGRDPEA